MEIANKDAENCKGSIIFIERGNELKFDLSHNIRLVDINKYSIHDFDVLYGFICGICSDNYDISEIFVDTVLSVGSENLHEFEVFVGMIKDISEKRNIKIYTEPNQFEMDKKLKYVLSVGSLHNIIVMTLLF